MKVLLRHLGLYQLAVLAYAAGIALRLAVRRVLARRPLLVLIRAGGLGDVIATLPSVQALRQRHPRRWLVYGTRSEFREIPALVPEIDQVIAFRHADAVAKLLRRFCDARIFTYGDEMPGRGSQRSFVEEMAVSVGLEESVDEPRLAVEPLSAEEFVELTGGPRPEKMLALIHVGPTAPVREWPREAWQKLVDQLIGEWGATVLQIGVARHFLHGGRVTPPLQSVQTCTRELSLHETAQLLRHADLFIGVDSGPLHLALAVGAPAAGLFGPVDPRLRTSRALALRLPERLPCQFCHHRVPRGHWDTGCPQGRACLCDLSAEAVFAQLSAARTTLLA